MKFVTDIREKIYVLLNTNLNTLNSIFIQKLMKKQQQTIKTCKQITDELILKYV